MATIRGNDGNVSVATNTIVKVVSFELDVERQLLEDTGMGDAARTFKGGFTQWSGRITARFDPADTTGQKVMIDDILAASAPASKAMVFTDDTGQTWSGNALPIRMGLRQEIDGIVEIDFELQGDGALTPSFT